MFRGLGVSRWFRSARDPLQAALGHLEREVMDILWRSSEKSVRDVQAQLRRPVAYTTVMTTLDRLFKKDFVSRRRDGRAFLYTAKQSAEETAARLTSGILRGLLSGGASSARPVLSNLVDAVGEGDESLLDELERLIRDKRQQIKDGAE